MKCPSCGHTFADNKNPAEYSIEFETFWTAYETRKRSPAASKPDAMKAWRQTDAARPALAALLLATKGYHAHIDKTATPACHPATWLRQERWSGFLAEEKKAVLTHESWPREIAEALTKKIGVAKFNIWLGGSRFVAEPIPAIVVSTGFRKDYIRQNLAKDIYAVIGKFHILMEP